MPAIVAVTRGATGPPRSMARLGRFEPHTGSGEPKCAHDVNVTAEIANELMTGFEAWEPLLRQAGLR